MQAGRKMKGRLTREHTTRSETISCKGHSVRLGPVLLLLFTNSGSCAGFYEQALVLLKLNKTVDAGVGRTFAVRIGGG